MPALTPAASFAHRLAPALQRLEGRDGVGLAPPQSLARVSEQLRAELGRQPTSQLTERYLDAAIERLLAGGQTLRARDDLVLAGGLRTTRSVLQGGCVALRPDLMKVLLERWSQEMRSSVFAPLLWRAVFLAYFLVDTPEARLAMRRFLIDALPHIRHGHAAPTWLPVVLRHQAVFGDSPGEDYAENWLDGDVEALQELVLDVELPEASWFWGAFTRAASSALGALRDGAFVSRIPQAVALVEEHPLQADAVLAAVLERLAGCEMPSPHEGLLQSALARWGNPQLETSDRTHLWSQVSAQTRQMVCRWLAEDDLRDFFELIRSSRALSDMDNRRFEYWSRFTGRMDYTRLMLGAAFKGGSNADVRRFISKRRGRLGWLKGGTPDNAAILMKMGDYWFVEFGQTGFACYPYRDDLKPFDLSKSVLERADLSVPERTHASGFDSRWVHRGAWEPNFDARLAEKGIYPNDSRRPDIGQRKRVVSAREHPVSQRLAVSAQKNASTQPERPMFGRFHVVAENRFLMLPAHLVDELVRLKRAEVDNRNRGGRLWIELAARPSRELIAQMQKSGFRYADPRGFYS